MEFDRTKKYFKVTSKDEFNGFINKYKEGINTGDRTYHQGYILFNDISKLLYDIEDITDGGYWIWEVSIPENENVSVIFDDDDNYIEYCSRKVILKNRMELYNIDTLKYLVELGMDLHSNNDRLFRFAAENGYLEVTTYLLENNVDIHVFRDAALRSAAFEGHLNTVKYLIEQGADIDACGESTIYTDIECSALQKAMSNEKIEVAKYLINQGANTHLDDEYSILNQVIDLEDLELLFCILDRECDVKTEEGTKVLEIAKDIIEKVTHWQ